MVRRTVAGVGWGAVDYEESGVRYNRGLMECVCGARTKPHPIRSKL